MWCSSALSGKTHVRRGEPDGETLVLSAPRVSSGRLPDSRPKVKTGRNWGTLPPKGRAWARAGQEGRPGLAPGLCQAERSVHRGCGRARRRPTEPWQRPARLSLRGQHSRAAPREDFREGAAGCLWAPSLPGETGCGPRLSLLTCGVTSGAGERPEPRFSVWPSELPQMCEGPRSQCAGW